jgi:uncharacterized protein
LSANRAVNSEKTLYFLRCVVLTAIRAYQRYLSPYKGFSCAYHEHTGHASCSVLGFRAVRWYGAFTGLAVVRERTRLCGVAHRRFGNAPHRALHAQHGVCDVGCDLPCDAGCDMPSGSGITKFLDVLSCCDCGSCDWPQRKNRSSEQEKYVYIPPKAKSRTESSDTRPNGRASTVPDAGLPICAMAADDRHRLVGSDIT